MKKITDWMTPTTKNQRFIEAMRLICNGHAPSNQLVDEWFSEQNDGLQQFACEYAPQWAQGIAVIEAATILANQPTEGIDHER